MIKKQRNINFGAAILFLLFIVLFFVLFFRFAFIQVTGEVKGQALAAKAKHLYSDTTVIEAKRGTIYDRNGEVIAEDRSSYSIIAILDKKMTTDPKKPNHVQDMEKTARELSKYIDLNASEIQSILQDGKEKGKFQVEFGSSGKDISFETKKKIEVLKLPGISFTRNMKRFYPNGVFASHVIGFTELKDNGKNGTDTVGVLGVEKSLNDLLSGTDGSVKFESDLWGYLLPNGKEQITPAVNGKDVYLTIDRKIQILLEDALNSVDKEYKPKKMIAIVADAKTGEILAMGQRPSFDPETRQGIEKSWYNEAIETPFEPGSTFKVFTLASAVQEGVFDPNELFKSGTYVVDPKSKAIADHNGGKGWGPISYMEGVQRSSNVAFAKLANEKLGFDTFRQYLTKFGFDQPTGIDLPNEKIGNMAYTYPIEKATTAFGQGTAVTAIQQVQAATAISNDGKMMRTHVINKIVDPDTGKIIKGIKPEVVGTPISENTAKQVRDYLETVITSDKGTGQRYAIDGYEVAGKTGTAQIAEKGVYLKGGKNYIFSFLGMAPKDDPKLIMYVAVQQPEIEYYSEGSIPVSMIFNPVMKNSLQYFQIQPGENKVVKTVKTPDLVGMTVEQAKEKITTNNLNTVIIGNGSNIVEQLPAASEELISGEKVVIKTDGELTAPDMTNWSIRDVMKVVEIAKMKLNSVGNGYVVGQNISPGSVMQEGEFIIIELKTPVKNLTEETEKSKMEEEQQFDEEEITMD